MGLHALQVAVLEAAWHCQFGELQVAYTLLPAAEIDDIALSQWRGCI